MTLWLKELQGCQICNLSNFFFITLISCISIRVNDLEDFIVHVRILNFNFEKWWLSLSYIKLDYLRNLLQQVLF